MNQETSPAKRALVEIRRLREQLQSSERKKRDPVAVIGVGLRFPGGASDLSSFWTLLQGGRDAITEIPPGRWDIQKLFDANRDQPGKMSARHGAFLENIDQFDPEFFDITPREADSIDPQHRLLLEVTWEALEKAAIPPTSLAGSQTGVFLGISNNDYLRHLLRDQERIDAYSAIGGAMSIAAGRISYFLGAHGPSLVVDTACSSTLVAIHTACQSLSLQECSLALAGGANLILSPEMHISFSKARMLADDGRCKTFSAQANGYVRGEGCAVVVLKRLADAVAAGDSVLAVIRGSAVNQDGRSAGITAPNGPAQEAVMRSALQCAGVDAMDVDYVEAHGTGTPLGDPIEIQAIGSVYGRGRSLHQRLRIGSVKTNIGHLEAAAGIAGLIKVILALNKNLIPPHLHVRDLSPFMDWKSLPLEVATSSSAWNPRDKSRIAGVSSFGFSGTNCHIIVEEPPADLRPTVAMERPTHLLCISARSEPALHDLVCEYEQYLAGGADPLPDVAFTANAGRTHHRHRLAVQGCTLNQVREKLGTWRAAEQGLGSSEGSPPQLAFLFSGEGSQYAGMALGLYKSSPVFREALDRCDEISRSSLPKPLKAVIQSAGSEVHESEWAQPAIFAIEYALAELWRSWGIVPDAVIGWGLGEYGAACVAGVLELEDALGLVIERAKVWRSLPPNSVTARVSASEHAVRRAIADSHEVAIAAVDGPNHAVISGEGSATRRLLEQFVRGGTHISEINVRHPIGSPPADSGLDLFDKRLAAAKFSEPRIAFISAVTGKLESRLLQMPSYWRRHVEVCVRFGDALRTAVDRGQYAFVEIGPHPVLTDIVLQQQPEQTVLGSLARGCADWEYLLGSLRSLYLLGSNVNWAGFDRGYSRRKVTLPTYPFQRVRCWFENTPVGESTACHKLAWSSLTAAATAQGERGLRGSTLKTYGGGRTCLDRLTLAYLRNALALVGVFRTLGECRCALELTEQLGILPRYRGQIESWLRRLEQDGWLQRQADRFTCVRPLRSVDLKPMWHEVEDQFNADGGLLAYLRHCGDKIAQVIGGRETAQEAFFPGGSFDVVESLYERSWGAQYTNSIVAAAVQSAVREFAKGGGVRILELGGGTGATSRAILPLLPPNCTEYWFTDIFEECLAHAKKKLIQHKNVCFSRLDLDAPIDAQAVPLGAFHVVIAAGVLHETRDLGAALAQVRQLLIPGGIFVLQEPSRDSGWSAITTGFVEGLLRRDAEPCETDALLEASEWREQLKYRYGFEKAECFPPADSPMIALGQHVVAAQVAANSLSHGGSKDQTFSRLAVNSAGAGKAGDRAANSLSLALVSAPEAERFEMMTVFVRDTVKRLLRLASTRQLGLRERFTDLGMDSLMALELKAEMEKGLGLEDHLPSTVVISTGTTEELAKSLLKIMFEELAVVHTALPPVGNADDFTAEELNDLSDEQVEVLLMERLRAN